VQPGETELPQRHEAERSADPRSGSCGMTPLPAASGAAVCGARPPSTAPAAEPRHPSSPAPAAPAWPAAALARDTPRPYDTALHAGPPHPEADTLHNKTECENKHEVDSISSRAVTNDYFGNWSLFC